MPPSDSSSVQCTIVRLPIVGLTPCPIPVTEDGRTVDDQGEPIDMDQRPEQCGKDSAWMIGGQWLCDDHMQQTCTLTGWDYDELVQEAFDAAS